MGSAVSPRETVTVALHTEQIRNTTYFSTNKTSGIEIKISPIAFWVGQKWRCLTSNCHFSIPAAEEPRRVHVLSSRIMLQRQLRWQGTVLKFSCHNVLLENVQPAIRIIYLFTGGGKGVWLGRLSLSQQKAEKEVCPWSEARISRSEPAAVE